jgi:hypothetical protein
MEKNGGLCGVRQSMTALLSAIDAAASLRAPSPHTGYRNGIAYMDPRVAAVTAIA